MRNLFNFLMAMMIAGSTLAPAYAEGGYKKKDSPLKPYHELIEAEQYQQAINELGEALRDDPDNADMLNLIAYSNRKLKNFDIALDYYQQALAIEPDHRGANEYLGELYLQTGQPEKAEERLKVLDEECFFGCDEYVCHSPAAYTNSGGHSCYADAVIYYREMILDRASESRKDRRWLEQQWMRQQCRVFMLQYDKSLMRWGNRDAEPPQVVHIPGAEIASLNENLEQFVFLGLDDSGPLFALDVSAYHDDALETYVSDNEFVDLRDVGWLLDSQQAAQLAYARGLVFWNRNLFGPGKTTLPVGAQLAFPQPHDVDSRGFRRSTGEPGRNGDAGGFRRMWHQGGRGRVPGFSTLAVSIVDHAWLQSQSHDDGNCSRWR
jgi:tetratricopeptide (TPR) repeat protein